MNVVKGLKSLILLMIIVHIFIVIYQLSRPHYGFWDCVFNPAACVTQATTDVLIGNVGLFINPWSIIVLSIVWYIAKRKSKKK